MSERKYVFSQLEGPALHLDTRDTIADAIVAHSTACYDIGLSGTGGNATGRGTREMHVRNQRSTNVLV